MNEKTALIQRLIDYAEADPPVLFSLTDDASLEDLDEAVRIISDLRSADPVINSPSVWSQKDLTAY